MGVSLTMPGAVESVRRARAAMVGVAEAAGASITTTASVRLATSEAVTNAVRHAYDDGRIAGNIRIEAKVTDRVLVIEVADDGPGLRPRLDSPGLGMGLALIAQVSDAMHVGSHGRGGAVVRMHFNLP